MRLSFSGLDFEYNLICYFIQEKVLLQSLISQLHLIVFLSSPCSSSPYARIKKLITFTKALIFIFHINTFIYDLTCSWYGCTIWCHLSAGGLSRFKIYVWSLVLKKITYLFILFHYINISITTLWHISCNNLNTNLYKKNCWRLYNLKFPIAFSCRKKPV